MRSTIDLLWSRRANRDRAIVRAVVTALGAKGCGFLLQIIAIPYAVRTLGIGVYGTYATASALFGWVSLVESGVGANAVRSMVVAINGRDYERLSRLFLTNLGITTLLGIGFAFIFGAALLLTSLGALGLALSEARNLLWTAIGLCSLQIALAAVLRTRGAFQETHINNLYGAAASLLSAVLLYVSVKIGGSALTLLLSLNAPTVVVQLFNGITLWASKPEIRRTVKIDWGEAWILIKGGAYLSIAQGGVFLERESPKLLLAATVSVAAVGQYACAVQILLIVAGLVVMVSTPLMPAIAEAHAAREHRWWRRRLQQILCAIVSFGSLGAVGAYFYGPLAIAKLFGPAMDLTGWAAVGLSIWCTVVLLSHTLFVALVAIGRHRVVAFLQVFQGAIIFLTFYCLYSKIGLGGMFWVISVIGVLVTFLPWLYVLARQDSNP